MRLEDKFNVEPSWPKRGNAAKVVGWFPFCDLVVNSGKLWVGDPMISWSQTRWRSKNYFRVPSGKYRIAVQLAKFGKGFFSSRLRVCLRGSGRAKVGREIAEIGTDSALIGVADFVDLKRGYEVAFGDDYDKAKDFLDQFPDYRIGVLAPSTKHGPRVPFLVSGLGDGMGPVFELLSDDIRAGIELEFIPDGFVYE